MKEAIRQWNQEAIREHLLQKEIQWITHGRVMGTVIRTVRIVLHVNALLKQQSLHDESLAMLMYKVESID